MAPSVECPLNALEASKIIQVGEGNCTVSSKLWTLIIAAAAAHAVADAYEKDEVDPMASPTTPLHFGKRHSGYVVKEQSLNGKKMKTSNTRSHHIEGLQVQLTEYMKATGMDQSKVVQVLEKLKEGYMARGSEQQHEVHPCASASANPSPVVRSASKPKLQTQSSSKSLRLDDPPVEPSTIALLQQKFAQLEKYKEAIQNQHVQLYPATALFSSPRPSTRNECMASNGFYYPFEPTKESVPTSFTQAYSRSSVSGTTDAGWRKSQTSPPHVEPVGSPTWSSDSSASNNVFSGNDEAADALLQYMLQPPATSSLSHQKVGGPQGMNFLGSICTSPGIEKFCGYSVEVSTISKETSESGSYPVCLSGKSSPSFQVAGWASGTSVQSTPSCSSAGWEREASEAWHKMPEYKSYSSGTRSVCEGEVEGVELDTSLHL